MFLIRSKMATFLFHHILVAIFVTIAMVKVEFLLP